MDAQGLPVADATVVLFADSARPTVVNGEVQRADGLTFLKTSKDGALSVQSQHRNTNALVLARSGYALVKMADVQATISLSAWGKIAGTVKIADQVGVDQLIRVGGHLKGPGGRVDFSAQTRSDSKGAFRFDQLPAERHKLKRMVLLDEHTEMAPLCQQVQVQSGQTTRTQMGGQGSPMVGRVVWENSKTTYPINYGLLNLQIKPDQAHRNTYQFKVNADGTFRIEDVLPGTYNIAGAMQIPNSQNHYSDSKRIIRGNKSVTVAAPSENPNTDSASDNPKTYILSIIKMSPRVGETAMDFEVPLLSPQKPTQPFNSTKAARFKLSDHKGKLVLIQFWATWCGSCVREMPHLQEVWQKYGNNDHFEMISLALNGNPNDPTQFAYKKNLPWKHGFLEGWSSKTPVAGDYGVKSIPRIFLVGPDGTVQGSLLRGSAILKTLDQAMAKHHFISADRK
jgi:thiol-disulfide isomerase/thioredoxin